jgi:hypothetical protein
LGYLYPPPSPAPVVVQKDVGGLVSDYKAMTETYRRENREVRLHECRSACTLALSLPNVCVYPTSVLKFHSAYHRDTRQVDPSVSAELFNAYPQAVRQRLGGLTREYHALSGRELIDLGVRDCTRAPSETMIARAKAAPQPAQVAMAPAAANPFAGVVDGLKSLFGAQQPASPQPTSQQVAYASPAQGPAVVSARPAAQPQAPESVAPPPPPPRPADLADLAEPRAPQTDEPLAPQTDEPLAPRPFLMPGAAPILPLAFTPFVAAADVAAFDVAAR